MVPQRRFIFEMIPYSRDRVGNEGVFDTPSLREAGERPEERQPFTCVEAISGQMAIASTPAKNGSAE
jgi:hypothetical protein